MPLSGVIKSGAGCIIHAGGAGRGSVAGGGELQPTFTSSDITTKLADALLRRP